MLYIFKKTNVFAHIIQGLKWYIACLIYVKFNLFVLMIWGVWGDFRPEFTIAQIPMETQHSKLLCEVPSKQRRCALHRHSRFSRQAQDGEQLEKAVLPQFFPQLHQD